MSRLIERIDNFNRAYALFSAMRKNYLLEFNDTNKLALIQSYEIVIELGWKILKDYLSQRGVKAVSPLDAVKEAFAADIILNGSIWIDMIRDRNISSHEYSLDKTDKITERISTVYFEELNRFKEWTGALND